ncbi:MAG: hypothetical protein Q8R06_08900 [Polaromonas sp.]|uniref:hypothetical protein n=1 Tax=Polaromonas sp. TaxID=1869339 RepID=UPI002735E753|nr:hypothetical protein [Polaromonas sp.]MDP3797256.1 hypothetical protein [Polaromonas sp.]
MKTIHSTTLAAAAVTMVAAVLLASPGVATAQTTASKPAAPATKPAAKPAAAKKPAVSADRTNLKTTAKNVAAGIEAAEDALTPAELAIAERVHVGNLPCELGASVTLAADTKVPGYFDLQGKNFRYRMFPVATTTGAIRLEDRKAGAVWLQLANKSMLMNQKLGIRLADECMSPAQVTMAEALKLNPPASVLDAPKPAAPPAMAAAVTPEPAAAAPAQAASAAR